LFARIQNDKRTYFTAARMERIWKGQAKVALAGMLPWCDQAIELFHGTTADSVQAVKVLNASAKVQVL
jgi:hypothetical protein